MDHGMIDADSHVNEPAEVWQARVPAALRDRAPRMVEVDDGRIGWSFEGGKRVHRVTPRARASTRRRTPPTVCAGTRSGPVPTTRRPVSPRWSST